MKKAKHTREACPCGSGLAYEPCCAPLHAGAAAASAEALMRSRYSAYVRKDAAYLQRSWHASTRPESLDMDDGGQPTWLGLDVRRHETDGDRAVVEFVARFRIGGSRAQRLHEISRFVREEGQWYYVDGDHPA
ncbi:YchJ family metal-binding protein [Oleiagrimonas sp. C23AA]|uniref:YchJ family protein n=1 Tax=Oleiagrimonas sp. C23AA TaxID=2719047 RepID=UPI001424372D|nr:YchJ family metal-binding protein [Oleiagrimonas sp. C23AA]NII12184.1 hypothetical protein [Oleiagrimonas sp. C23AA]